MKAYQKEFFEFAIELGALRFGEFTLKSGRVSPYFFNAGLFNTGASLARLGGYYADTLLEWGQSFDMLFGPAYKGIPLVCTTAIAMARKSGRDVPYCFNRKEIKDHGEGGSLVGATLKGKVVVLDDVISAGISVDESIAIIDAAGARAVAVGIALDRQEKTLHGELSAAQAVTRRHAIPVLSVADLDTLLAFLKRDSKHNDQVDAIRGYRERYGCD